MEFRRITGLPPYVFTIIDGLKQEARRAGNDVIDLGFGNPDLPSPQIAVEKLAEAAMNPKNHRYSQSKGIPKLRQAAADAVASGRMRMDGPIAWGVFDETLQGEFFPALLPEAVVILAMAPHDWQTLSTQNPALASLMNYQAVGEPDRVIPVISEIGPVGDG